MTDQSVRNPSSPDLSEPPRGIDPLPQEEINRFFHSHDIEELKRKMCEIGRRMWQRHYTDGNGGNLSIRVAENLVLCTPTLVSKGFMKPREMCLVDVEGNQLAGGGKRTSEILTHLGIFKRQPRARACCHAHPPYATAYALAAKAPPEHLTPEAEVFLGQIGLAEYRTPGTLENAETVGRASVHHPAILMVNHGVITWARDIEQAYWRLENLEAYCQTVFIAERISPNLSRISGDYLKDLESIRKALLE